MGLSVKVFNNLASGFLNIISLCQIKRYYTPSSLYMSWLFNTEFTEYHRVSQSYKAKGILCETPCNSVSIVKKISKRIGGRIIKYLSLLVFKPCGCFLSKYFLLS